MQDADAIRMMPEPIVVFDTNVLITLPLAASRSTRLFLRLDAAGWKVAASPQILIELADKLHTHYVPGWPCPMIKLRCFSMKLLSTW